MFLACGFKSSFILYSELIHGICRSNNDAVHLKLIWCCVSIKSQ